MKEMTGIGITTNCSNCISELYRTIAKMTIKLTAFWKVTPSLTSKFWTFFIGTWNKRIVTNTKITKKKILQPIHWEPRPDHPLQLGQNSVVSAEIPRLKHKQQIHKSNNKLATPLIYKRPVSTKSESEISSSYYFHFPIRAANTNAEHNHHSYQGQSLQWTSDKFACMWRQCSAHSIYFGPHLLGLLSKKESDSFPFKSIRLLLYVHKVLVIVIGSGMFDLVDLTFYLNGSTSQRKLKSRNGSFPEKTCWLVWKTYSFW